MNLSPFEPYYDYIKNSLNKQLKNKLDAEDTFQEILIYLWNKEETIIKFPKTYFYTLAKWFAIKHKPEPTEDIDNHLNIKSNNLSIMFSSETGWNLYEIDDNVYSKLKKIPNKYLEPLMLKIMDKKSIKQISDELKINENTVKTNIKRAKEFLAS